jgi:hypothetical protein
VKCAFITVAVLVGFWLIPVPTFLILVGLLILTVVRATKKPKVVGSSVGELERWNTAFEKSYLKHGNYATAVEVADRALKRKR